MSPNEESAELKPAIGAMRPYLITAAAILICYILFGVVIRAEDTKIHILMAAGIAICGLFGIVYRKSQDCVILAILMAGVVMRIGYMLYTPYFMRAHDVASINEAGHLSYIHNLFAYARLPQTNDYEYYQPPLQHIAQAAVVKAFSFFRPEAGFMDLVDSAKLVPCFASCAVLFVCRRLCEALGLSGRANAIAMAVLAFQPTFYVLSASINNDALMLLFFMISVLYTVRWYHTQTMKHIVCIALGIGLAAMTKLSGSTAALFTAPVFLLALITAIRQKRWKPLLPQFAAFLLICAPLALWYPIRNYMLFQQPLNYVVDIGRGSPIYCGDRTIAERFLSLPLNELISPVYCRPTEDCNIWLYTLKCSVFGEYTYKQQPEALAAVLILANLALILMSLAAMVYILVRGKDVNGLARYGLCGIWAAQFFAFIVFNAQYPFACTMDFRYIMPTAITGALYIGILLNRLRERRRFQLYYPALAAVIVFSAASMAFYMS